MVTDAKGRGTIVVVEDDPCISALLATVFESENYDVVSTDDGSEAVQITKDAKANLITLDLSLPGMNGQDVLRCLKSDETTKDIPVIIISAHADYVKSGVRNLAERIIHKPFDIGDLLDIVDNVIGQTTLT